MGTITFDWFPEPIMIANDLNAFAIGIKSYKEPLKRSIQQVIAPSLQKNFDEQGRPYSWPEDTTDTYLRKTTDQILIESGTLRKVAGQLNIWDIQGLKGVASLSDLPGYAWYGKLHQVGNETTPARPWALIQEEDVSAVEDVFATWLSERAERAGFTLVPF